MSIKDDPTPKNVVVTFHWIPVNPLNIQTCSGCNRRIIEIGSWTNTGLNVIFCWTCIDVLQDKGITE